MTDTTVDKWDMSAKPDQTVVMITNSIFNAIGWEKHYTVKERQELNDVIDELVAHSLQQAREEERERILGMAKQLLGYQCGKKDCDAQLKTFIDLLTKDKK